VLYVISRGHGSAYLALLEPSPQQPSNVVSSPGQTSGVPGAGAAGTPIENLLGLPYISGPGDLTAGVSPYISTGGSAYYGPSGYYQATGGAVI